MLRLFTRKKRAVRAVAVGLSSYVSDLRLVLGARSEAIWRDPYVIGYLGTAAAFIAENETGWSRSMEDIDDIVGEALRLLAPKHGAAAHELILEQRRHRPAAFDAGAQAAEKVISVGWGRPEFESDPQVIDARDALHRNNGVDHRPPDKGKVAAYLRQQLFWDVVETRLGAGLRSQPR